MMLMVKILALQEEETGDEEDMVRKYVAIETKDITIYQNTQHKFDF